MKLSADLVESFSGVFLSPLYDAPKPTPDFHREVWGLYCSDAPAVAVAAPRGHAKSTAITHDFVLANVCWRVSMYIIILGASEEAAIEHLGDIASELRENDDLRHEFKIKDFITDQKTDIVVGCTDGHQFRIIARGAEQKIRGRKWRGRRPDLIVCDDLEDDEQVENKDRRKKFRKWFLRAVRPALRSGGKIRVHGTILHKDSLLKHLTCNSTWKSKVYKAHKSFSDFSDLLWIEMFPEAEARTKRQEYIEEGDSAGYSQEYLNDPRDDDGNYLLVEQFLPLVQRDRSTGEIIDHRDEFHRVAVGCDFAVSKADAANRTCFVVGGKTIDNYIDILDVRVDRWDSKEWVDEIFSIHQRWPEATFYVEDGVIWKAVWPIIRDEMALKDEFIDFVPTLPVKDKATRGQTWRKRMKAGRSRFDKEASWYSEYEEENLDFSATQEATLDDQFDATVTLARGFDGITIEQEDAMTESEEDFEMEAEMLRVMNSGGRSKTTGY